MKYCLLFFLFLCALHSKAQKPGGGLKVSGIVKDIKGKVLPGATIRVLGTKIIALSTVSGDFSLIANSGDTLEVSYVGYES